MSRVLVAGACGRMGERIRHWVNVHADLEVTGALEAPGHPRLGEEIAPGVTLTADPAAALAAADVVIDFMIPDATLSVLRAAAEAGIPYVTGTTGCSDAQLKEIETLAQSIPVVHAANFSVSVNVLGWLAREAARRLGEDFDQTLTPLN